jgi:hypothetical protein
MSGFYGETIASTPGDYSCWNRCRVLLEGGKVVPISNHTRLEDSPTPAPPSSISVASSSPPLTPQALTAVRALPTFRDPVRVAPQPLEIVLDPVTSPLTSNAVMVPVSAAVFIRGLADKSWLDILWNSTYHYTWRYSQIYHRLFHWRYFTLNVECVGHHGNPKCRGTFNR